MGNGFSTHAQRTIQGRNERSSWRSGRFAVVVRGAGWIATAQRLRINLI